MNFNSLEYAAFLPIVFALYWALAHKFRGVLLLISSYYFYMSWNPQICGFDPVYNGGVLCCRPSS